MFITHLSAEVPFGNLFGRENARYWRAIEYPSLSPWIFVEIAKGNWGSRTFFLPSVPDFEQFLSELDGEFNVRNAHLVSPGYMNNSTQWAMQRLAKVCEVTAKDGEMAYQYTFDNGGIYFDPTFAAQPLDTTERTIFSAS